MSSDHNVPHWPAAQPSGPGMPPPPAPPAGGFAPLGQPLPGYAEPRRFRPVSALGDASIVLICLAAVANIASTFADWNAYRVVRNYLADVPTATDEDLTAADDLTAITGVLIICLVIAAGVVFMNWLWRARSNAELLSVTEHRRRRGWIIGGWFCPIVNLWFPKQIVDDIWRASDPQHPSDVPTFREGGGPTSSLVTLWWAAFIIGSVLDRIVARRLTDDPTVDSLRTNATLTTVSAALAVVAAVAVALIIRQITAWQNTPRHSGWQPGYAAPMPGAG